MYLALYNHPRPLLKKAGSQKALPFIRKPLVFKG